MRKFLVVVGVLAALLLIPGRGSAYIDCVYLRTDCISVAGCPTCHAQAEQVWYCVDSGEYVYILGGCCICT